MSILELTVLVLAKKSLTGTFEVFGGVVVVPQALENEEGEIVKKSKGCAEVLDSIGNEINLVDTGTSMLK